MRRRLAFAGAGALLAALGAAPPAQAHALESRVDLPIPEWLFVWAASLVLIVSFVTMSVAWREPKLERPGNRNLPRLGWLLRPPIEGLCGALGVALLVLVVWSGFAGTSAPDQNFAPTFVFVTFWLGMAVLSVLFGNVFRAFNPWRAIARTASWIGDRVTRGNLPAPLPYPSALGRWPAVAGIIGFLLLELVFSGETPDTLATAALIYTATTLLAMGAYGTETWLDKGEAFSVYFRMLSFLSPFRRKDDRIAFGKPLRGAWDWFAERGSVALVLVVIGATAFDGATEGPLVDPISTVFGWLFDAGVDQVAATRLTNSAFLIGSVLLVAAVFWLGAWGMDSVRGAPRLGALGGLFAHSLIPIALAYLVVHYLSFFLYQVQAQFTFLLSDPLGKGWDLFGTASGGINYSIFSSEQTWYIQVGALVIGHVTGLVYAHDKALVVYGDVRSATRSQYWMLAVMVAFTSLGLFLLSQANQ